AELPVEPQLLAQLLEIPVARVTELCEAMAAEYEAEGRGFTLVAVAGGWRFQSHSDLAPYVERFVLEGQSARLSAAALETLAIVAYKQPVSRAQVAAIRGVNVDGVMRTLHLRGADRAATRARQRRGRRAGPAGRPRGRRGGGERCPDRCEARPRPLPAPQARRGHHHRLGPAGSAHRGGARARRASGVPR